MEYSDFYYIFVQQTNNNTNNLNLTIMKASEITKTINKLNIILELAKTDSFYKASLGFQRISVLPVRVRKNINLACILKGENNDNSMKEFLNTLTEEEFINWLRLA